MRAITSTSLAIDREAMPSEESPVLWLFGTVNAKYVRSIIIFRIDIGICD